MTCPYCGHRDVKPGGDACASCDAEPEQPPTLPAGRSSWASGAKYSRHRTPEWWFWRGEWRRWERRAA